eukprot:CAMPEP_0194209934 /NCGR_PEP_ID=MMETSP0156-20130528/7891_1 /TAXON_ID=33649 /ORGANISM="Thalassionema nitzschioides, Strain L26-B" /LENGTH=307 /DNA_ID=CAMNT_0038937197 /DNA_START=57 /DNA_END=980 /DNA_ORIENTATION=+
MQLQNQNFLQSGGASILETPTLFPQLQHPVCLMQHASFPVVESPGINDVMCGRGGGTNNHIGNIRFRQLINDHKLRYLAAPKVDKPKVAMEVVQLWRKLDPPGRFLAKKGGETFWQEVGDKRAREKASQCLRERTAVVMPFVRALQEKERKDKEQKKRNSGLKKDVQVRKSKGKTKSSFKPAEPLSLDNPCPSAPEHSIASSNAIKGGRKRQRRSNGMGPNVALSIPTAAALMENLFDDREKYNEKDNARSYVEHHKQFQFQCAAPNNDFENDPFMLEPIRKHSSRDSQDYNYNSFLQIPAMHLGGI